MLLRWIIILSIADHHHKMAALHNLKWPSHKREAITQAVTSGVATQEPKFQHASIFILFFNLHR